MTKRLLTLLPVLGAVALAWAAACWFSQPFGRPFLGLPPFQLDAALPFSLALAAFGLALLLWLITSSVSAFKRAKAWLVGNLSFAIIVALLLVAHLCLQLPSIVLYQGSNNADSGQYGIAAYHIAAGEIRPMYMLGKHHIGSLPHHLIAVMNLAFGKSAIHLRIVTTLFYLAFIVLFAALLKLLTDARTALLAAALAAIPPLHIYQSTAYTEFPEIIVWGTLALLICVRMVKRDKPSAGSLFALGIVAGLGLWAHPQFLSFLLAVFLILFFKDKLFFIRPHFLAILPGFAIGGIVIFVNSWFYRLPLSGELAHVNLDLGRLAGGFADAALKFFLYIPTYLGLQARETATWLFHPVVAAGVLLAFAAAVVIYLIAVWDELKQAALLRNFVVGKLVFALLMLSVFLVFVASEPLRGADSVRYVFPIWPALAAIIAIAGAASARRSRVAGYALTALFIAVFLFSTLGSIASIGERQGYHRQWVEFCRRHGITRFYGPWVRTYWTSYVTEENIIGANFPYQWEPFPKYQTMVAKSESPLAYMFDPSPENAYLMRRFDDQLSALGVSCRKTRLAVGIVYYDFSKRVSFFQLHGIVVGKLAAEIPSVEVARIGGLAPESDLRLATISVRNSGDVTWLPAGRNGYVELVTLDNHSRPLRRATLQQPVEPGELSSWRLLLDGSELDNGTVTFDLRVNDVSILKSGLTLRLDQAEADAAAPLSAGDLNPVRLGGERHNLLAEDFLFLDGWGERTDNGIWSSGGQSRIAFVVRRPRELELIMRIRPFEADYMPSPQHLTLALNGLPLAAPLALAGARTVRVSLPAAAQRPGLNLLILKYGVIEPEIRPVSQHPNLRLRPRAIGINYLRLRNPHGDEGS